MPPHLNLALSHIADFLAIQHQLASVQGFLYDLEGYTLLQLAAYGEGIGAIVEIGSYMGRSTAFLAAGAKRTGREKVYAVDHFKGSPEHQRGEHFATPVLETEGTTFGRFQANLQRLGLSDQVVPIRSSSAEAAANWQGPIRLLFIDGDHAYDAVRRDYHLWSPFVVSSGYVSFHDVGEITDVTRFYKELTDTRVLQELFTVQSLKVARVMPRS